VTDLPTSSISRAQELATQLAQILELEFQALRQQELDQFEQLQPVKTELLSEITTLAPPAALLQNEQEWQCFRDQMLVCRDLHRRNEVLIERKLESIRGTLQSLRVEEATSPIEVYNRLGQVARFSRAQGYSDA
jgi:flagellar biosynthesis/type III secretory pathway chaperone